MSVVWGSRWYQIRLLEVMAEYNARQPEPLAIVRLDYQPQARSERMHNLPVWDPMLEISVGPGEALVIMIADDGELATSYQRWGRDHGMSTDEVLHYGNEQVTYDFIRDWMAEHADIDDMCSGDPHDPMDDIPPGTPDSWIPDNPNSDGFRRSDFI